MCAWSLRVQTEIVYCDFTKAYDAVCQENLLLKLQKCRAVGSFLN